MTSKASPYARKLLRADLHIGSLEAAIDEYFRSDWYQQDLQRNPDGNYSLRFEFREPPDDFGALVGDVVHNLRAALDLLAVELVRLNGGNVKDVYFPFAESASALEKAIIDRRFHRASKASIAVVRSLQPYKGGNRLLRALHDLDIQDKHRTLIPVVSIVSTSGITVGPAVAGDISSRLVAHVDPNHPPQARFIFPADSALADNEIVPALKAMRAIVAGAIEAFFGAPSARGAPADESTDRAEKGKRG